MGEFLVSKKGIGYLIMYGTQVFNLNLVMTGIVILIVLSFLIYELIVLIKKGYLVRISFSICLGRNSLQFDVDHF